jgi:hypothetical protein
MELFPDVITVDSLVLVQPSSKNKAEFLNDATDHVRKYPIPLCSISGWVRYFKFFTVKDIPGVNFRLTVAVLAFFG